MTSVPNTAACERSRDRFPDRRSSRLHGNGYRTGSPRHCRSTRACAIRKFWSAISTGPTCSTTSPVASGGLGQICQVIDRFRGQSGIVYCITRAEVDKTTRRCSAKWDTPRFPYHAGLSDDERIRNQEAFLTERADTIVATIAFGMGIDKSNVRYVIHAGMPKSLEHYQQESGRAGRDGVEAECWLLYSGRDLMTWKRLLDSDHPAKLVHAAMAALEKMNGYATAVTCRHAKSGRTLRPGRGLAGRAVHATCASAIWT